MMKHETILITGATGFLGVAITRGLFEAGFHLKLLVRKTPRQEAKERLFEIFPESLWASAFNTWSDRIEIIEGDISRGYLGLNTADYLRLADTVDEVFHCAAATKFNNDASDTLSRTNGLGTELIATFCMTKKIKRLHYISTAYVAGKRHGTVLEDELEMGQQFNNNYERSKYEAEKNLCAFAKLYHIPYTIYRPSIVTGDTATGYTKNYDNIYVFANGLRRLKNNEMQINPYRDARSISRNSVGYPRPLRIPGDKYSTINLAPVDYVTAAIITISRQFKSINKVFHIVNPSPPTLGELAEWMKVATGNHCIKIVSEHEFYAQPCTLQERLFLQKTKAFMPYMFGEPFFDSANTKAALSGSGIGCPLITQELITRFVRYAADTNWGRKTQPVANTNKEMCDLKFEYEW